MLVDRIPVSTMVKTGAKVAAAFIGSFVFAFFVFVVALVSQVWLATAFMGPVSGSSAAGLAFLVVPVAFIAAAVCWPVMSVYLFSLLERIESQDQVSKKRDDAP